MELAEALKQCVVSASASVAPNAPGEFNAQLFMAIDPETEAGRIVAEFWNTSQFLEEISAANS
ncbi:hypothetical protein [Solidesulfovibrio carbinolicus]|uniref:Uncharacterized protein n=1 Tax=Solidesulfovibrio carbinolicus TaxID=296842 RepID=A0A4V0YRG1_9BACT|nr:hypothetical protein [Solidesulfovibrio carbinolicus]QAZ69682.1 hypothetical protein C3Y92_20615 [Solidesulfovibrio carbinolicus]